MKTTRVCLGLSGLGVAFLPMVQAVAATLTVCQSGCIYSKIQAAIDNAQNNDTISIQKGHYFERIAFDGKPLTVKGVNNRQVIIDGNGVGPVVSIAGEGLVSISDVSITRGKGKGGGIYLHGSASLNLANSIIVSNYSTTFGGGIDIEGGVTVVITGCAIVDNEALEVGGGIYTDYANVTVDNSTVARNSAQRGGGIANQGEQSVALNVTKSSIVDNFGGGILVESGQSPDSLNVKDSTIAGNSSTANGGAIMSVGSNVTLENVDLTRNSTSGKGGGIFSSSNGLKDNQARTSLSATYIGGNVATAGGGTYLQGTVANGGNVSVAANVPDNCGKSTTCP